jgi:hypothetical protein
MPPAGRRSHLLFSPPHLAKSLGLTRSSSRSLIKRVCCPLKMPPVERRPSYIQSTPKRAMASFENLVALANYEERLKEARKIVWRDRGELPVEVHDFWECLEHGARGGMSTLSFSFFLGLELMVYFRSRNSRVLYSFWSQFSSSPHENHESSQVSLSILI